MSLYYKFVAVRQEGFLSSSCRQLGIRFFSKALFGEHRALSFLYGMAMILTVTQTFRSHAHCITPTRIFFNIFKHVLLHESHCPGPCSKEIYLLTLKALRDNWIVTRKSDGYGYIFYAGSGPPPGHFLFCKTHRTAAPSDPWAYRFSTLYAGRHGEWGATITGFSPVREGKATGSPIWVTGGNVPRSILCLLPAPPTLPTPPERPLSPARGPPSSPRRRQNSCRACGRDQSQADAQDNP